MSDPAPRNRPNRRGRGAPPAVTRTVNYRNLKNPFPPMKVFSDDRIAAMHEAALDVLENLGVRVLLPDARDHFTRGGATLKDGDMIHIGRDMVEAALASAPKIHPRPWRHSRTRYLPRTRLNRFSTRARARHMPPTLPVAAVPEPPAISAT